MNESILCKLSIGRNGLDEEMLTYMSPMSVFTRRPDYRDWVRSNSLSPCQFNDCSTHDNHPPSFGSTIDIFNESNNLFERVFALEDGLNTDYDAQNEKGPFSDSRNYHQGTKHFHKFNDSVQAKVNDQYNSVQLISERTKLSTDTKHESTDIKDGNLPSHRVTKFGDYRTSEDGYKASRKTTPHKLPKCKVCGIQATGFHYGVNSCEACKGFFHRSLLRNKPYKCFSNSKCEILPGKRNVCGRCRYKRCLDVGMSKEGIKTGRYTYEKRTKDILEIQNVDKVGASPVFSWSTVDEEKRQRMEEFIQNLSKEKEKLLSEVQLVDKSQTGITIRHQEAPEKLLYIPYEPPDPKEDGGKLWRKWASVMENTGGVRRVIKFVKTIPGFRELEIADQIQLIKHSFIEIWLVARHKTFDIENQLFQNRVGFSFDLVKALGDDGHTLIKVASRLKILDLNEEETSLMLAMVTFFSDRCPLINAAMVDKIQEDIVEVLHYVVHTKHPREPARFHQIMSIFVSLRVVTEMYHNLSDRVLSNIGDIAPLLWEIVNLS